MRSSQYKFVFLLITGSFLTIPITPIFAQSQALNGQIEGTVLNQTKAPVFGASVSVTNLETGANRTALTDEGGLYRFALLPLGSYRLVAEAANYSRLVREGITLTTGQTGRVDLTLAIGDLKESVNVVADTSIVDAGKTDIGRVMNTREVQNLPLVLGNPYNFALLQANVNGRPSRGGQFPRINANGYLQRVNYQLDGNTNTQADRAGIRLTTISDTFVSEVQLITNGFAAEFGNTPGLIMNVVTPSGTNQLRGSAKYKFRRPSFYSRPFFFPPTESLPDNEERNLSGAAGAPLIKDRWHFYAGYEYWDRDDKAIAARLSTITEASKVQLIAAGLPSSTFVPAIPVRDKKTFFIFRTDTQISELTRITARFNLSNTLVENLMPGGINTMEKSTDTESDDQSFAAQFVSLKSSFLNELRFQFTRRKVSLRSNEFSGTGPAVVITNVANFGTPETIGSVTPHEKITQVQNNLTWTSGSHLIKFGGGFNFIDDFARSGVFARYTFATIADYVSARNGTNPRSYSRYEEASGDPEINYRSTFWSFFAQDDWIVSRRLKINYGIRYDLYCVPEADPTSPLPISREFNLDKNNFAPRLGIVYSIREGERPTVLRAGAGIYYEQPWLNMYERAVLRNGNPRFFNFSLAPNAPGAPSFPVTFPGGLIEPPQDIDTIAPDLENLYAIHANIQLEQALTKDISVAIGYAHSAGRQMAVYRNINLIPISFLLDGRPVFSRLVSPITRFDPRFNNLLIAEAAGVSQYDAVSIRFSRRFARGLQFSANYTLSKATDDSPEQNLGSPPFTNLILTDPYNRQLDKGRSFADQRHTFVFSLVARPSLKFENKTLNVILNGNQIGAIVTANSGTTFNILSNVDINRDGLNNDRPVGIGRNSGTTPPLSNVDLRYSRFFDLGERFEIEVFGEFVNLLNANYITAFNNVAVATHPTTGELLGPLPVFKSRNQSTAQESRQFQIGLKFHF